MSMMLSYMLPLLQENLDGYTGAEGGAAFLLMVLFLLMLFLRGKG